VYDGPSIGGSDVVKDIVQFRDCHICNVHHDVMVKDGSGRTIRELLDVLGRHVFAKEQSAIMSGNTLHREPVGDRVGPALGQFAPAENARLAADAELSQHYGDSHRSHVLMTTD
jgi:hypothetical protein